MKNDYLVKRGEFFYFCMRTPKSMKHCYSKAFIRKALHTDDLQIARERVNLLLEFLSLIFVQGESSMLTETQIDNLVNEFLNKITSKQEQALSRTALPQHDWNEKSSPKMIQRYQSMLEDAQSNLSANKFKPAAAFMSWVDEEKNITIDDEIDRIKLSRAFLQAAAKSLGEVFTPRMSGEYIPTNNDSKQEQTPLPVEKFEVKKEDQIGELIKEFYKEKISSGYWKANTQTDVNAHIEVFLEYFGKDTVIQQITKKHLREYRDKVLKRLPKRRKLNKVVRDLPLEKQLANTSQPKISPATINCYLVTIQSFFNWCVDEHDNIINSSPANKLSLQIQTNPNKRKLPYSNAELTTIITELSKLTTRGKNGKKNIDRIWITLLGMYQGMRENEICQLNIDDIVIINNIPCISSTASTSKQSAKNYTSFRTIPIHKTLLEMQFLNFVNQRREVRDKCHAQRKVLKEEKELQNQLFVTMTYNKKRGSFIKNFLSFFTKFNREKITSSPKKSFHSLRHNFASKLENSSKINYAVSYLAGHSFKTETAKTYTDPDFEILSQEISRLEYDFDIFKIFNFSPLDDKGIEEAKKLLPVEE